MIDYTPPWRRLSYADAFREHVGVAMDDTEAVKRKAEQHGFPAANKHPDVVIQQIVGRHLFGFIPSPELVPTVNETRTGSAKN